MSPAASPMQEEEEAPASERRGPERRARERRSAARPEPRESWFGALGEGADTAWREAQLAGDGESRFDGAWPAGDGGASDSRFLTRQAQRIVDAGQTAFVRVYRAFLAARAAIGVMLLITLGVAVLFGVQPSADVLVVCLAYAALSIGAWLMPFFVEPAMRQPADRLRTRQWLLTIGVDIVCFTALHVLAPVAGLNYVALFVLPALMAGVLTPRRIALATSAGITLVLLGAAWHSVLAGGDVTVLMSQAGLAGSGMFVITVLASELAGRLAREELTARGSLELARQQAQLNRLVIEEMQDGVVVVDRRGRVRAANPAACALLAPEGANLSAPFALRGVGAWSALVDAVERAFVEGVWPEAGRDVLIEFEPGASRTLRTRVRFTRRRDAPGSEEFCVLFLEDVRSMQARTRQEKLAAMGRVSAGIAHEIRNPLSAIAQANALLAEDAASVEQRQLTRMVADNVARLKRIVDDVMELSPRAASETQVIDAGAHAAAACAEWARMNGVDCGADGTLQIEIPAEPLHVLFDGDHLRRVLVNLLDNALRHASRAPGAVQMLLHGKDANVAVLTVLNDGPPIAPEVERYFFEPFFSTRSRGTGLGLYICRELCERYGARISFRLRPTTRRHRNEFSVAMRRQALTTLPEPAKL
ncbi:MAG: HAMP domain-containing histidine kinase [Rhizobacter sp.]|nr:HAMP domain-containing histidine kinase [Rhizobacter sp.]